MKKVTAVSRGIGYTHITISFITLIFISFVHFHVNKPQIVPSITILLVAITALLFGFALGKHRQKGKQTLIRDLIPREVYQVISLTRRQGLGIHRTGFIVELALASVRSRGGMRDHETLILKLIGGEMSFDPHDEFVMICEDTCWPRLVSVSSARATSPEEHDKLSVVELLDSESDESFEQEEKINTGQSA